MLGPRNPAQILRGDGFRFTTEPGAVLTDADRTTAAPRKTLADLAFINLNLITAGIVVDVSEDGLGVHSAVPMEISST